MVTSFRPIPDDLKISAPKAARAQLTAQPRPNADAAASVSLELPPEEKLTFWQKPWAQNVLPFVSSAGVHLLLVLVAWATFATIQNIIITPKFNQQIYVPVSTVPIEDPGVATNIGVADPGFGGDPTKAARQNVKSDIPLDSPYFGNTPRTDRPRPAGGGSGVSVEDAISFGLGSGPGVGRGLGGGVGDGVGNGDGGLGYAPFGAPGGGGGMAKGMFAVGHGAKFHSVIYICDGSGSMMGNKIDVLKNELNKSIHSLQPHQQFDCMFFQDSQGSAFISTGRGQMLTATPENKDKAKNFLDEVAVRGSTNPIPALEQAFKEQPVLVYLLTDGEFDDPDTAAVEAKINALNAGRRVHVNTILFLRTEKDRAENHEFEESMKKIAAENGGEFREFFSDQL
jgi:hypothetical protein